jgi:uncharacterized protein with HEPN domain
MSRSTLEYLRHILDETAFVATHVPALEREAFLRDETLKRAVVRSLEIIGEAAKKVPGEFREKHAQVDWRLMAECETGSSTTTLAWITRLFGM